MILSENSLKPFLHKNLPWFVRQSYPTFVAFLEAYYQWLEVLDKDNAYGVLALIDNFKKFHDIDHTLEELLPHFKRTFSRLIPEETSVETRVFIKKLGELYRAKGTEDSFRFLIYILTGQESTLFYPRTLLASPSSLLYGYETFIHIKMEPTFLRDTIFLLKNQPITINKKTFIISDIIEVYGVYRFYIYFDDEDFIEPESEIFYNNTKIGTCLSVLNTVEIVYSEPPFLTNSVFTIFPSIETADTIPAKILCTGYEKDKITTYRILNPGVNYDKGDLVRTNVHGLTVEAIISELGPFGEILALDIISSDLFDTIPPLNIHTKTGTGASIQWTSFSIGKPTSFALLDVGNGFGSSEFIWEQPSLKLKCNTSVIGNISKVFKTTNLLGHFNILSDNYYYQRFSYEINTEHNSFLNVSVIDSLLHPIGYKRFFNRIISPSADHFTEEKCSNFEINLENISTEFTIDGTYQDIPIFTIENVKYAMESVVFKLFGILPFITSHYTFALFAPDIPVTIEEV